MTDNHPEFITLSKEFEKTNRYSESRAKCGFCKF